MTSNEYEPNSGEDDPDFDAVMTDVYTDSELDLIQYLDAFYDASKELDDKVVQFMQSNWKPYAHIMAAMTNEMTATSIPLLDVVKILVAINHVEQAVYEIAEVILHDLTKREIYFKKISTVEFEKFSSGEEMALLFIDFINKNTNTEDVSRQIMTFYQMELARQLKALTDATIK